VLSCAFKLHRKLEDNKIHTFALHHFSVSYKSVEELETCFSCNCPRHTCRGHALSLKNTFNCKSEKTNVYSQSVGVIYVYMLVLLFSINFALPKTTFYFYVLLNELWSMYRWYAKCLILTFSCTAFQTWHQRQLFKDISIVIDKRRMGINDYVLYKNSSGSLVPYKELESVLTLFCFAFWMWTFKQRLKYGTTFSLLPSGELKG